MLNNVSLCVFVMPKNTSLSWQVPQWKNNFPHLCTILSATKQSIKCIQMHSYKLRERTYQMKSIHSHYHSNTEICISNSINPKVLYIQASYITWKVSHTLDSKSLFIFLQLIFNKKILLKNEKEKKLIIITMI